MGAVVTADRDDLPVRLQRDCTDPDPFVEVGLDPTVAVEARVE